MPALENNPRTTKLRCAAQLRHYGDEYLLGFPDWVFAHCGLDSPNWDAPEKYYGVTFREYWEKAQHNFNIN